MSSDREETFRLILSACSDVLSLACFYAGMETAETVRCVRGVLNAAEDGGPNEMFAAVGRKLIELSNSQEEPYEQ